MSGIVNRIRIDGVRDTVVEWNVRLNGSLPPTESINSSISPYPYGPPVDTPSINPGPLADQNIYFVENGLTPSTTYILRVWHSDQPDGGGNVLGEAFRFVQTFPAGSVSQGGPVFTECGDEVAADQERATYGYHPNQGIAYGQRWTVRTVASRPGELGEDVA